MTFLIEKYHFKTTSLLEGLPKNEFRLLKDNMSRKEIKKGKLLYKENSYSKGVYILRKGKIKIYQTNKDGKEQIVYIYSKGESMGYRPIICGEPHPVSAAALENSVVSFIPRYYFQRVLENSLVLSNRLLVNLSHEFTVWTNKISVFAHQPVRERVALSLLILNKKYSNDNNPEKPSVINISRNDLANYVGTAEETLVRMLQDFKLRKIIRTEGRKIIILKPKELELITDLY
ncbi:MAG: Crp/Fnr family transcriptional regulator [Bacteroidia bacterium]|jgi:CRP-like cAMP-binding protein